jgi:glutathione synthase/RimK-type ligase-like ATP-grasp enzyme
VSPSAPRDGERLAVLVTSGRFPPATPLVRAFHEIGARVDVADSYALSPALHSHRADRTHLIAPPASQPLRFVEDVAAIVRDRGIDLVVPSFEETYFLARYADRVPAPIFTSPFATVAELHDKSGFVALCERIGLPIPATTVVRTQAELAAAVARLDAFVARPAFSRGGLVYLTNHGPRAGESRLEDCRPTSDNPWLVQPYVEGQDACSFSVVRDGEVLLHCPYEPTIAAEGGWSIQFTTVEDFGSLERVRAIARETRFTGCIGFDYRRTGHGLVMIEANPRASAGAFFPPGAWLAEAITGSAATLRVVPAGLSRQYDAYLLDPHIASGSPATVLRALLTTPDAFFEPQDVMPALCFLVSRRHWSRVAREEHVSVGTAFVEDMSWEGTPMPEFPAA